MKELNTFLKINALKAPLIQVGQMATACPTITPGIQDESDAKDNPMAYNQALFSLMFLSLSK